MTDMRVLKLAQVLVFGIAESAADAADNLYGGPLWLRVLRDCALDVAARLECLEAIWLKEDAPYGEDAA